METSLIKLKLLLNKLGIPADISTLNNRKRVQKAVYIGQVAGMELGYSYGWYLMGPYSPELTKEYFNLRNVIYGGDEEYLQYKLKKPFSEKLEKIIDLMNPPEELSLAQEDWLEIVASVLYLANLGKNIDGIKNVLSRDKKHLLIYADTAYNHLKQHNLVSS